MTQAESAAFSDAPDDRPLNLAVLTAGGHAIDVAATARRRGFHPVFYDDDPDIAETPRWVGRDIKILPMDQAEGPAVIGHNDPFVRQLLALRFPFADWTTLVDPAATGPRATRLGAGCHIAPGVVITERVQLGAHVHVNVGATISQATTVGDFATVSPGAHICGDVTIGDRTWIGAGAIVKDHITIGNDVIVGCGAVVIRDVDDRQTVVGVPAKRRLNPR